jgi:hypothetical protein
MRDGKFWRMMAIAGVAALFYVGHGLHEGTNGGGFSLAKSAHAGGIAMRENERTIYTTSEDGRNVFIWQQTGPRQLKFVNSATALLPADHSDSQQPGTPGKYSPENREPESESNQQPGDQSPNPK